MHSTLRKLTGELLVAFPCGSRGVHLHHTCVHPSYLTSCLPLFRATNHRPTDSNRPSFLSFFLSFFFFSFVGLAQTRSPLRNSPHFSLSPHASYLVSITSFATHPRRYIGPGDNGEGQTPDTTNFVGGGNGLFDTCSLRLIFLFYLGWMGYFRIFLTMYFYARIERHE